MFYKIPFKTITTGNINSQASFPCVLHAFLPIKLILKLVWSRHKNSTKLWNGIDDVDESIILRGISGVDPDRLCQDHYLSQVYLRTMSLMGGPLLSHVGSWIVGPRYLQRLQRKRERWRGFFILFLSKRERGRHLVFEVWCICAWESTHYTISFFFFFFLPRKKNIYNFVA